MIDTAPALQSLLLALHKAATLWSIADTRRSWGKGFARFTRPVEGMPSAALHGLAGTPASAHMALAAAQRKVDAEALFAALTAVFDALPCFTGSAFAVETAAPTKSGQSPTFTCSVDGIVLGDTNSKQTAISVARKLVAVAGTLSPMDWTAPRRGWATLDGAGGGRDPLLAPDLETAQIKLSAIQQVGVKPRVLEPTFQALAEVHAPNFVRRDVLMQLVAKGRP